MRMLHYIREILKEDGFTIDYPQNDWLVLGTPSPKYWLFANDTTVTITLPNWCDPAISLDLADPAAFEKIKHYYHHGNTKWPTPSKTGSPR